MDDHTHPPVIHGTTKDYIFGFVLSLILTFSAYFIVVEKWLNGWLLYLTLAVLAGLQALVQLLLFLHLGEDTKPKWKLMIFLVMIMVLSIIVSGSLWIMYSLNERVMPTMAH